MNAFKSPIPVLPLRDIVVFPNMIVRLFVGREKSVFALEEVMKTEQQILLVVGKALIDSKQRAIIGFNRF